MSAMSRTKGAAFERTVANLLTEATGSRWRRRVRQHDADSDVVADDPAMAHLVVECKHADRLCLPDWWRQAQAQCQRPGQIPVLVYRQTGGPVRVQLDAHHVHPATWPAYGRHVVTLDWEAAVQWLREQIVDISPDGSGA